MPLEYSDVDIIDIGGDRYVIGLRATQTDPVPNGPDVPNGQDASNDLDEPNDSDAAEQKSESIDIPIAVAIAVAAASSPIKKDAITLAAVQSSLSTDDHVPSVEQSSVPSVKDPFDKNKTFHLFKVQSYNDFIQNYRTVYPEDDIVRVARAYFYEGASTKILRLSDTELLNGVSPVLIAKNDKPILREMLGARADTLEHERFEYIVDIVPKKIAENIRRILLYINRAKEPVEKIDDKPDDILGMMVRMAYYLLHPKEVQPNIRASWNTTTAQLRQTDLDKILGAINALQAKTSRFSGKTNTKITSDMKQRLIDFLTIVEGVKTVSGPSGLTGLEGSSGPSGLTGPKDPLIQSGGSSLSPFISTAMEPIMEHIRSIYPMYFIRTHLSSIENLIPLKKLIDVCEAISHTRQYGFYRIRYVPYDLFKMIQIGMANTFEGSTSKRRMYVLCLGGNLSFTKVQRTNRKQKKDWKALKGYFQSCNLYLVHTRTSFSLSDYMKDPYVAYEMDYGAIDDQTNTLHIRPAESRLNEETIDFNRYLRVHPILDCTYLEMCALTMCT